MSLKSKPSYTLHRLRPAGTVDVALATLVDDLKILKDKKIRGDIDAWGFKTIEGFIQFVGGTAPTAALQILEVIQWPDPTDSDAINEDLVASEQANLTALVDKQKFRITIAEAGRLFLRVAAVTGTPTSLHVFVTGGEVMSSLLERRAQS
ncbi:hypothetical protein LCGC14_0772920 [marine sediment metagenome]|uniref:Uncharacterized protein n=1 Tax=marine sediment metagenome TaxID=412755 RepID=A0A0F9SHR4_9ZZZZ